MKTLFCIGGTMGVGKTAVSNYLKLKLSNSVFLDGDWCWDMHPFQVNAETKEMVIENICFLLNQFMKCSVYENIVFCWVMHEQGIIDDILGKLRLENCQVKLVSLICGELELRKRIQKDVKIGIRTKDSIEKSVERIPLYQYLNTIKIDTSEMTVPETAERILNL